MNKKLPFLIVLIALLMIIFLNYSHPGVLILHYHSINNSNEKKQEKIRIYPKDFVWQMNYLKKKTKKRTVF